MRAVGREIGATERGVGGGGGIGVGMDAGEGEGMLIIGDSGARIGAEG